MHTYDRNLHNKQHLVMFYMKFLTQAKFWANHNFYLHDIDNLREIDKLNISHNYLKIIFLTWQVPIKFTLLTLHVLLKHWR